MIIDIQTLVRESAGGGCAGGISADSTAASRVAHIPLHVLALLAPGTGSRRVKPVIKQCFPESRIAAVRSPRRAMEALRNSVFDLVVIAIDPFNRVHIELLEVLRQHPTPMPTLLLIPFSQEAVLEEQAGPLPYTWEILHLEALSPGILRRRLLRAIETHERHWELSHLQHAFQSSLAQYRSLFDEVPDLIFLCDRSGCLLDVNATAERMFGHEKSRLLMHPIFDVFGLKRDDFERLLDQALADRDRIEDFEIELRPPGRQPVYGLTHMIRWQSGPGRPVHFQVVVKDISPHKMLECQLRQSEDQYKTLYELARINCSSLRLDDVVHRSLELVQQSCSASGVMLFVNRNYEELYLAADAGMPDDLRARFSQGPLIQIGQGVIGSVALSPEVQVLLDPPVDEMHPALAEWMERLGPSFLCGVTIGRTNPTLPTSIMMLILPLELNPRQAEEQLGGLAKTLEMGMTNCFHYDNSIEAERRYRELWEQAPTFFISLLKGGIIFEINQTAVQALGYSLQELIGHPIPRIIDPEDHARFDRAHRELMELGIPQAYELRLVRKGGERVIVSLQSQPLLDRNGQRIGEKCALNDITEDRRLRAALSDYAENLERRVDERTLELTQAMNFLNGILEGSTEHAIVALDDRGTFLHFNRGAQLLFGHDSAGLIHSRPFDLLIDLERAPYPSLPALLEEIDRRGVLVAELPMLTRDGRRLTALLTMNRLSAPAANNLTYVAIMRDISEQKEMEELLKLYTENLQQLVEQKTRELDRQHMQLIQSSKLATLGEMATGIAHELNQPLSGIRTRAQLVQKSLERDPYDLDRVRHSQHEIIELVDRISHIIHHMRIFARQDQQHYAPFDIRQSVQGALSLLGEQLRIHNIDVRTELPDEPAPVNGEPLQIEQVILNLVSNARDAMDGRHESARRQGEGASYHKRLLIALDQPDPGQVRLRVADNGTGIPADQLGRIFDPFFTTKPVGRGTGLGLSISYGIISNHGGRIEVESNAGQGTVFHLLLPVHLEAEASVGADDQGELDL